MSRLTEAPVNEGRLRIPTKTTLSGLHVAEGVLPGTNGSRHGAQPKSWGVFHPNGEGLLIREKKNRSFDFVIMTDFGGNSTKTDLANAEVDLNIRSVARENGVEVGAVTLSPLEGFSTINTGFATAQLALHKKHGDIDRVYYINTNPRLDPEDERSWTDDDNFGKFVYAKLDNGARIFTVNTKYNLSFVKDHIAEAWVLKTDRNDQFLSRFQFVQSTMAVLSNDRSYYDRPLDTSTIADVPEGHLIAQDGNGNLKTSWQVGNLLEQSDIVDSPVLSVTINGKTYKARNSLVSKDGETGELVVQGGSSGYDDTQPPTDEQYVEAVVLHGTANTLFEVDVVSDNTPVAIKPASGDIFVAAA